MALSKMSASDCRIIFECLIAAARGPFFSDADLRILYGLDRKELLGIVDRIPRLDDSEPGVHQAIGDTLLNLLQYPHGKDAHWSDWISVSRATVEQIDARWAALLPPVVYDSFHVFGPAYFGGRFYRVVEYHMRGGGRGWGCEVWSSGLWLSANDGPGGPAIMAATPASPAELLQAGVDCSPLPSNYDPLRLEGESSAVGASEDAAPGTS